MLTAGLGRDSLCPALPLPLQSRGRDGFLGSITVFIPWECHTPLNHTVPRGDVGIWGPSPHRIHSLHGSHMPFWPLPLPKGGFSSLHLPLHIPCTLTLPPAAMYSPISLHQEILASMFILAASFTLEVHKTSPLMPK